MWGNGVELEGGEKIAVVHIEPNLGKYALTEFEIIQGPSFAKKLVKPHEDWIDMNYLQSR